MKLKRLLVILALTLAFAVPAFADGTTELPGLTGTTELPGFVAVLMSIL
jgi:hypothetical protein